MVRKIVLALLGQIPFEKSAFLALLSNIFLRVFEIERRTKILTEYWYDRNNDEKDIYVLDIDIRWEKCLGVLQNDVKADSGNLQKAVILEKGLCLSPLADETDLRKYVEEQLEKFKNHLVSDKEITRLLCTPGLDEFIRKVTLRVPANDILRDYIEEKDINIIVRDTKDLLRASMGEGTKKPNINLSEIGLDGVVFECSDNYPNVIKELYQDVFRSVFQSVPIFLISRDNRMFSTFGKKENFTKAEVEKFLDGIQNNENPDYEDTDDVFFRETYKLLDSLKIMQKDTGGEYSFSEAYFGGNHTKFIIPASKSLVRFSTDDLIGVQLSNSADLRFLQTVVSIMIVRMTDFVVNFRDSVVGMEDYARDLMLDAVQKVHGELRKDFVKYDRGTAIYCFPQLQGVTKSNIETVIDDVSQDVLSANGSITTKRHGKFRYYATVIVAISSRKWLDHIISAVSVEDDICDVNGKPLFSDLSHNYDVQTKLIKSVLRNHLYHEYIDNNATIHSQLCVNRYKAAFGIEERRKTPTSKNAFEQTVETIVNDFCHSLETVKE